MSRAAVIQMNSGPDVAANLTAARSLLEHAAEQGARLAALPENFSLIPERQRDRLAHAETPGDGPAQAMLIEAARSLGLWIVGGTLPMADPDDAERVRACSLLLSPDDGVVARYDKIHLFDVEVSAEERYLESATFAPGDQAVVADTPVGRLGLTVCYDVRFPELSRSLSAAGAQLLTVPSAFTLQTGAVHWDLLTRARAVENLCYVLAPNQCGQHAKGRRTYGDSLIADPWGQVLARCSAGRDAQPGVAVADVDLAAQTKRREGFPALNHRRTFASPND